MLGFEPAISRAASICYSPYIYKVILHYDAGLGENFSWMRIERNFWCVVLATFFGMITVLGKITFVTRFLPSENKVYTYITNSSFSQ